jgi:sec-independent protein translocase protein TatA
MGLGGISIWQLLIVLAIVMLVFGTKRLKGLGGDLGGAMKGFKQAMKDNSDEPDAAVLQPLEKAGSDRSKAT